LEHRDHAQRPMLNAQRSINAHSDSLRKHNNYIRQKPWQQLILHLRFFTKTRNTNTYDRQHLLRTSLWRRNILFLFTLFTLLVGLDLKRAYQDKTSTT